MLTSRHLAVIRAAVRFWDEEMTAADTSLFSAYLDDGVLAKLPSDDEVAWLRENLARLDLRFVICSENAAVLADDRLFESIEEAKTARPTARDSIATVLIFSEAD